MAAWGEAMTWTHPLWDPPSADALKQGLAAARRAKTIGGKTRENRAIIEAVLALYEDHDDRAAAAANAALQSRHGKAVARAPIRPNAAAFHALSLLSLSGGSAEDQTRQAAKLLVDSVRHGARSSRRRRTT